jgi:hypothetical protein
MSVFQFQSVNFPDHFIRHRDFLGELTREVVGESADFSFQLVNRGHDQQGRQLVSLRSVNFPDRYLRHRDFRIRLEGSAGPADRLFRADSTFIYEKGLSGGKGVSFRSTNFPDRYLRHRDFHLWLEPRDSPNLALDATFNETVRID